MVWQSSLAVVGDSSLPVAWGFLPSCSEIVSSSQISVGPPSSCDGGLSLAVLWLFLSSCGVLVLYSLAVVWGLLSSYG